MTAEFGYLDTARGAIAYQRSGTGERAIIWSSAVAVSIESRFENPATARWREFLESLGQVIVFDFRGFGISEHLPCDRVGLLEEMAYDLESVVCGLADSRPFLVATVGSTMPALSFLASRPGAVERAVLINAAARTLDPDLGGETSRRVASGWGTGAYLTGAVRPDLVSDAQRRNAARTERIGATPAVMAAFIRNQARHDVSGVLGEIRTPTLVLHTGDIVRVTPAMCEEVADGIPGASFAARTSTLFNWGDWQDDVRSFITGNAGPAIGYRDLASIVFLDVVGSTGHASRLGDGKWRELLGFFDSFVDQEASRNNGRVVKQTGDGHLLEFGRPGDAVAAAEAVEVGAPALGIEVRSGIHYGEIERRPNGDIGGIGVHIAARIAALAAGGQILVSRTVTELTEGSRHSFQEHGVHTLRGVPGSWPIYALEP